MKNADIAAIFSEFADILEIRGDNPFRISSYRRTARTIEEMTEDVAVLAERGELQKYPGIGKATAEKIIEYLQTGKIAKYEKAKEGIPDTLIRLLRIPSMGPKTVAMLHKKLKVAGIDDLKQAIEAGKLEGLPGMGAKKIENILKGIQVLESSKGRIPLGEALPLVEGIIGQMEKVKGVERIEAAGSLRRRRETIGDIDILVASTKGKDIIDHFVSLPEAYETLVAGDTKGSIRTEDGLQVDLRVVRPRSYGAALQYFTGSKAHNIRMRDLAKREGLKINEYGLFKGKKRLAGESEAELYQALGMSWTPPELREDRGEVEAALEGRLPPLVEPRHIKGDFHVHSEWSDGNATIDQVAAAAAEMGYKYLVISDHSQSLRIANGLTAERIKKQMKEIDRVNKAHKDTRLLKGTEVDILGDGRLDFPDEVLAQLDFVTASIHSGFKGDRKKITRRVIRAVENPYVTTIGHPTGRVLGAREAYEIDLTAVMKACTETGTALEINAFYDRLDLDDVHCRMAKEMGVKLAIGTDAHHLDQLWMMELGLGVARRGWLEPKDLLNCMSIAQLRRLRQAKITRLG